MAVKVGEQHFRRWAGVAALEAAKLIEHGGSLSLAREEMDEAMRWLDRATNAKAERVARECAEFDAAMAACMEQPAAATQTEAREDGV